MNLTGSEPLSVDSASGPRARGQPREQVVDPAVSRFKFEREVSAFRRHEAEYRLRGWLLLSADFPSVVLLVAARQLRPAPVLFGVELDFQNYDVEAPSVRLIDPWTREPLRAGELLTPLPRLSQRRDPSENIAEAGPPPAAQHGDDASTPEPASSPPTTEPAPPPPASPAVQVGPLMQASSRDGIPFLCMRGVREYHRHPAHTGDSWLLHRRRGEGTLSSIIDAIDHHGRAPINDYLFHFDVQHGSRQPNTMVQETRVRLGGFITILEGKVFYPCIF